jgi:tetratricopeptide (TPR) repeat protein
VATKRDPDRALIDLNRALDLDPQLAVAWALRGQAWAAKEEFAKAIFDFDTALKLSGKMADTYCSRAVTQLALGNAQQAESDFAHCRELGGEPTQKAQTLLNDMKKRSSGNE